MKAMTRMSLAILLGTLTGCMHIVEQTTSAWAAPKYQVKCAGDCLELNQRKASDAQPVLGKINELLKERRHASVQGLIERNAETLTASLHQRDAKQAPTDADLHVARTIDGLMQHPAGDGWHERLQGRGRGGLARADDTLHKAREFARNQKWSKAADLLQRSQAAMAAYPYHAIHAGLIQAEAHRHLGQIKSAAQAWQQTAVLIARLNPRLQTPELWEQLAGQRPVPTAWPTDVAAALASRLPAELQELAAKPNFTPESFVWYAIGNARLNRAETSEALTAFKRADSQGAFPLWDDFLVLHQAKALLAMQQTPAATSLLTALVGRTPASPWRSSALALLGSGKLEEENTQQALAFLREAIETGSSDTFWRADAEANLGLVYLMTGDEAKGLRYLHASQERFIANRNVVGAIQCLENEARYVQHLGKTDADQRIRRRVQELEAAIP